MKAVIYNSLLDAQLEIKSLKAKLHHQQNDACRRILHLDLRLQTAHHHIAELEQALETIQRSAGEEIAALVKQLEDLKTKCNE